MRIAKKTTALVVCLHFLFIVVGRFHAFDFVIIWMLSSQHLILLLPIVKSSSLQKIALHCLLFFQAMVMLFAIVVRRRLYFPPLIAIKGVGCLLILVVALSPSPSSLSSSTSVTIDFNHPCHRSSVYPCLTPPQLLLSNAYAVATVIYLSRHSVVIAFVSHHL